MTDLRRAIFPPAYMNLMDTRVPHNEIFFYFQNSKMTLDHGSETTAFAIIVSLLFKLHLKK